MGSITHSIPPSKRGRGAVADRRRKHILTRHATYRRPGSLSSDQVFFFVHNKFLKDTTRTKSTSVKVDCPTFSNTGTRCRMRDTPPSCGVHWVSGWPYTCQVYMTWLTVGETHGQSELCCCRSQLLSRKTVWQCITW